MNATPSSRSSSLDVRRDWLTWLFTQKYTLTQKVDSLQLSVLTDALLTALLPRELLALTRREPKRVRILDLKGRDATNTLRSDTLYPPGQNEILLIRGVTFHTNQSDSDESEEQLQEEIFELRLNSSFEEFTPQNHIGHLVSLEVTGSFPDYLPLGVVGKAFPMRIDLMRLGLDLFTKPKFLGWFSGTPTVTQTLLIEAFSDLLTLELSADHLSIRSELPLINDSRRTALDSALRSSLDFEWLSDFSKLQNVKESG